MRPRAPLHRDPSAAASRTYDLIVVGGGIAGAMVALEAARHGLPCLLLEADDFGGKASWASLRILHGGLRALQSLDLAGARAAAVEQLWFHRHFADLVEPLPCLLPLYGVGLRRPPLLRIGLAAHNALRRMTARSARVPDPLPDGQLLSPARTVELFPAVRRQGLLGAALWHDLRMRSSERIVIETLRWAAALGATTLNYVRVAGIGPASASTSGVRATDQISGATLRFEAKAVVEAIGPGPGLPIDGRPDLVSHVPSMLAFNLLLDRSPPAGVAIGVTPPGRGSRTYFLLPWGGHTLAGTFHAPASPLPLAAAVTAENVASALGDLDDAAPGLDLRRARIVEIYPGFLPASRPGSAEPARDDTVLRKTGGGEALRLARVRSVKFTMARRVATHSVRCLFPRAAPVVDDRRPTPAEDDGRPTLAALGLRDLARADIGARLDTVVEEEAVLEPADLVLRRVDSVGTAGDRSELDRWARRLVSGRANP